MVVPKTPPPMLGFNNNVRHKGRVFHIQTEDSGTKNPRIVTHLFADGGRIVKTTRIDYAEHVGRDDMAAVLRRMMKEQHKAMFISLRAGELDELIESAVGPSLAPRATSERPPPSSIAQELAPPDSASAVPSRKATPPPLPPRPRRMSNPSLRRVASVPPPPGDIELDVGSLDKHPPLPRNLTPAPQSGSAAALGGTLQRDGDGRYAASRPAAIFDAEEAGSAPRSIFGESVISEKSLDEVILSYLAEDLGENTPHE